MLSDDDLIRKLRDAALVLGYEKAELANLLLDAAQRIEEYASSRD